MIEPTLYKVYTACVKLESCCQLRQHFKSNFSAPISFCQKILFKINLYRKVDNIPFANACKKNQVVKCC